LPESTKHIFNEFWTSQKLKYINKEI
jgi:hypothetical protein